VIVPRRIFRLLDSRERFHAVVLITVTPLAALGEMGAVAAMLPFLSVVVDPRAVAASPLNDLLTRFGGLAERQTLVLLLGTAAAVVLLLTNALIVASVWMMLRFSWNLHHRLSATLLARYLHKPYSYFLSKNSAGLAASLVGHVGQVTEGILVPALTVFGRGAASLALIGFLGVTEPLLALAALGLISGIYGVFYISLARRRLQELGTRRIKQNVAIGQLINEAFGGIKEIKLLHAEQAFSDAYRPLSQSLCRDRVLEILISVAPRYIVEAVAFGGIVLLTLAIGRDGHTLPLLGTFAFAGYRLMPSIQHVFASLVQIRANLPALDSLESDLAAGPTAAGAEEAPSEAIAGEPISPRTSIELRQVTFRYPGAKAPALENFSLELRAKTMIGLIGPTGSGKTTVVDLLLGLLRPEQGELQVDGIGIGPSNLERWQRSLAYVPQHIYLSDTTIVRNVAFGVPDDEIDRCRVEEACRAAKIHDFIVQRLPDGYDTTVGERGVRLSGGERQRLGIARAIYRRREVLLLDEATSALDRKTEEEVMKAIHQLAGEQTIIMIAHRETTLRECDSIYRIVRGRLQVVGTYAALVNEESKRVERSDQGAA
jgi:ABC-type multidrug transport system fused ATPase/permease subunit